MGASKYRQRQKRCNDKKKEKFEVKLGKDQRYIYKKRLVQI